MGHGGQIALFHGPGFQTFHDGSVLLNRLRKASRLLQGKPGLFSDPIDIGVKEGCDGGILAVADDPFMELLIVGGEVLDGIGGADDGFLIPEKAFQGADHPLCCARKIIKPREKKEKHRILAVVGSVNPNTTAQMEELWLNQHPIYNVFVETKKLLESEEAREAEISRVTAAILEKALLNTVLTVTGDVTQSIFQRFSAAGLMLRDEVLPLAAYGQFFGGDFNGLSIVTKGGSQGGPNAINVCVNYLKEKLFILFSREDSLCRLSAGGEMNRPISCNNS